MAYIKHALGKTFYVSKGRNRVDNYPVIGIHGGPGGTHLLMYSLTWLFKDRRIILYDQIGSGKSSEIDKKHSTVLTFVKDLDRLIHILNVEGVHLYGASWGCLLALEYYLYKKGKGIKSITFQSPFFSEKLWTNDAIKLIKTLPAKTQKTINYCHEINATDSIVYQESMKEYCAKFCYRLRTRPTWAPKKPRDGYNTHGEKVYLEMWGPSECFVTGNLKGYDQTKRLKEITIPTLFLCGEHDEARPQTVKFFSNKIKNSRIRVIGGGSHSLLTEKPKETLKIFKEFLEEVEKP